MSISMKKWVDITSATLPSGADDRELGLRVITTSDKIEPDEVWIGSSADDVLETFGSLSAEYAIASKYFGYVSLSATKPEHISFWRPRPASAFPEGTVAGYGYCYATYYKNQSDFNFKKNGTKVYMTIAAYTAKGISPDHKCEGDEFWWSLPDDDINPTIAAPADDYVTSMKKCAETDDNFGTFFFIPDLVIHNATTGTGNETIIDPNCAEALSMWCAEQNYRFRFVQRVDINKIAEQTGPSTWNKISRVQLDYSIRDGAEDYVGYLKRPCTTLVLDDKFVDTKTTKATSYPEWLTCAILAATRYNQTNSTVIQEFKGYDSADMRVTCADNSLYEILTSLNVNFFGQTQKAGKTIKFYMEGYNADGVDTAVCDNEIWLKDRIVTEVFNRFVKSNKVPAGTLGRAMIKAAIQGVISEGLNNLAITPEKTISEADKAAIIQNTGASDAPSQIYVNGYYIQVYDDQEQVGNAIRRKVSYILYYSTGEGIRKVTGSHVMV